VVDQIGALLGAFIALLFAATLVFAWGYYDEVHAHFHVLMLLFMAAMIGFCLTHDLFNLFVWFEVMGVAAFALTGYQLRTSALEGAINFTIINGIGSYLFLMGLGLIYARLGVLDFSALEQGVARQPHDVVLYGSFALLAAGLLIKGAQVPFHFWLSDAHAVAPSPVSVIFSGAMVALGVYGVAKLAWAVFFPSMEIREVVRTVLLWMGASSIVLGGLMSLAQRHIKRLLAFSTISHVGVLLLGLSLLNSDGLAGMFVYLLGHGLVKSALFMIAGILLAACGGIDELNLRGKGKVVWPAGVVMAVGALLLAGLPIGLMGMGTDFVHLAAGRNGLAWTSGLIAVGAACTGGAVLRVAGRVFLGLGTGAGIEASAPTDEDREKMDRPLWLMLLPAALLVLLGASTLPSTAVPVLTHGVADFTQPSNATILSETVGAEAPPASSVQAPPQSNAGWLSVLGAIVIAAFGLARDALPKCIVRAWDSLLTPITVLQRLHNGTVGEYVAWSSVGLAVLGLAFMR
jgi:multicomponent Na+:H+ antiporter subunit D